MAIAYRTLSKQGYLKPMSLEQTLKTAAGRLSPGQLGNEAQVKQAVILPVLRALDWDDTDPEEFKPEYSVGSGWVDYALLDRRRNIPLVFIEAKQIGKLDAGGEKQLFRYASNRGVPFLVLTDGDRWDFYLSMVEGRPAERRFYRLELRLDHKIPEYTKSLEQYLRKDRIVSGEARIAAERRHTNNRARESARRTIPKAWLLLLEEPNKMLRNLLADKVESECGTKPELDDVDKFLKDGAAPSPILDPQPPAPCPIVDPPLPSGRSQPATTRIIGFILREERVETGTAKGTLIALVERLAREDPAFMERFASHKRISTRARNLVAKNRSDLYLNNPHLIVYSKELENGWWMGTNLDQGKIKGSIKIACDVSGVKFGSELTLIEI